MVNLYSLLYGEQLWFRLNKTASSPTRQQLLSAFLSKLGIALANLASLTLGMDIQYWAYLGTTHQVLVTNTVFLHILTLQITAMDVTQRRGIAARHLNKSDSQLSKVRVNVTKLC